MPLSKKYSLPEEKSDKNLKFAKIPVDEGTRIDAEVLTKINGWDAVHQRWSWDGVRGESLIFCTEDLQGISEELLIDLLQSSVLAEFKDANVNQNENGYTFVNFGFEAEV